MPPRDEGFTLIETVLTIALVSIAFVGILSGVAGVIAAGAENQHASTAETVVRNAAEYLKGQAYVACTADPGTTYTGEVTSSGIVPTGYAVVVTVNAWDGNSPATFAGPCLRAPRPGFNC